MAFDGWRDLTLLWRMPRVTVDLMYAKTAGNDPFYARIVKAFHDDARRPHPKFPFVGRCEFGVALCPLPDTHEAYLQRCIEPAARRNLKKSLRLGYTFETIRFNDHLDDVREIRASADVRQGRIPESMREVSPCADPPSLSRLHDYAYFGVLREGHLRAYAACLISGELCMLEHILGHAAYQADGVVPLLLTGIARTLRETYPTVRYFAYGTFFGGGRSLRRFKKKFGFYPHRVKWCLDREPTGKEPAPCT